MKTKVPVTVDVSGLVTRLNLSPTRSHNLTNKTYYFLSLIVAHNDNYRLNEANDGYRNICSVQIKKVLGNKDYYLILNLLLRTTDPIVETNQSWHNPAAADKKGFCMGYRLTRKYNSGELVFKTIPTKISKAAAQHIPEETVEGEMNSKYQFLHDQFDKHRLTFDGRVYDYVRSFGTELLSRVVNNNPYQTELIYNLIGRWLYYLDQIDKNIIWHSVSSKNHRLASSITNLPRILRPFLMCDDLLMGMADVSSSQPYILASVISDRFFTDSDNGYNLATIYPDLYKELVSSGYIKSDIDNSNTDNNNSIYYYSTYSGNTGNNYYSNNSIDQLKSNNNKTTNHSSIMWCKFFTPDDMVSISRYIQSPFKDDFYSHVIRTYHEKNGHQFNGDIQKERQGLKSSFMYVLFEDNLNHRNHNPNIQLVQNEFPGVDKWIREAHSVIGKRRFAHLLQRAESYLLLNDVCKRFNQLFPVVPLFTIHDAILTHPKYLPVLTSFLVDRLAKITGVDVGVKTKLPQIVPEPQIEDIDHEWDNIKAVTTAEKFNSVCGSVFSSNVMRGSDFLKKTGQIF